MSRVIFQHDGDYKEVPMNTRETTIIQNIGGSIFLSQQDTQVAPVENVGFIIENGDIVTVLSNLFVYVKSMNNDTIYLEVV